MQRTSRVFKAMTLSDKFVFLDILHHVLVAWHLISHVAIIIQEHITMN